VATANAAPHFDVKLKMKPNQQLKIEVNKNDTVYVEDFNIYISAGLGRLSSNHSLVDWDTGYIITISLSEPGTDKKIVNEEMRTGNAIIYESLVGEQYEIRLLTFDSETAACLITKMGRHDQTEENKSNTDKEKELTVGQMAVIKSLATTPGYSLPVKKLKKIWGMEESPESLLLFKREMRWLEICSHISAGRYPDFESNDSDVKLAYKGEDWFFSHKE